MIRRMTMVTPLIPSAGQHESAGEQLLHRIAGVMAEDAELTLVSGDGPANRRALARGGVPEHIMLPAERTALSRIGRALGMAPAIEPRRLSSVAGTLSRSAVVDLQWEENGLLLPAVRRLAPRALTVVTLHDVLSQKFARQRDQQSDPRRRAVWHGRWLAARALERRIMHLADRVVVLSEKDAALLPRHGARAEIHVVPPPIDGDLRRPGRSLPVPDPLLLFVGFMARWENEDAMHWFSTQILPIIRAEFPQARMAVAGGGLRDHVVQGLRRHGVEVLGYVADLEALYAEAAAVVVPLRCGAGVKFKVVEALVRGVPVVTTAVGGEGISPSDAAVVRDSPESFAAAVVEILHGPRAAEAHARRMASPVAARFGAEQFRARLKRVHA
ncbi:glycosyltransferase [Kocuria palustris]|uniref:glycosyltransferase n=1 Tax=Kocuria palustris TaxID=71999 RepID=UPI0011A42934|nr:glycosyltransferase [Kocuria palustris]